VNELNPEKAIFAAAQQLPPEDRAAYLDEACGDNGPLRRRIEALLNASEQSGAFLEVSAAPTLRRTPAASIPLAEKPGDKVGRYKLLQQIGEGGCGVVYMAEQEEPVRRRVALKIIKLGMDTRNVIARFEAERQALAMMDHPNIAKVFDAGATETGRPYFVMELVRGVKITDYCDEQKLSTRERLGLFMQVCHAIQHAHQKGIIHRDIKPSNILVTVNDGVPVPKVIDFGIAKATTDQLLTDKTIFTAFEQFIGTPAYMSPEQATMTNLDIDTRSDIYALGVLLYELLTGKTPFDANELLAIGLDAMRRTICEKEPERPSTRLSTMPHHELGTTAMRRRLDSPKLISELRGDLDCVVMRALEKDRARRYETANGLAMDIQRHLNNEPIEARPPGKAYVLTKLVRRHKLAFAAAGIVAFTLLGGILVSSWYAVRATRAEKVAEKERQQAIAEKTKAQEAEADANMANDLLQQEGAGRLNETLPLLEEKFKLQKSKFGPEHPDTLKTLNRLASVYATADRMTEAIRLFSEVLTPAFTRQTNSSGLLLARGEIFARYGRWNEAESDLSHALEFYPENNTIWHSLTAVLIQEGKVEGYRELCLKSVERFGHTTDPTSAERISRDCLILPTSGADLGTIARMTRIAMSNTNYAYGPAWCQLAQGLADYRQGHFTGALGWAEKALAKPGDNQARDIEAFMVQAMAYQRLNQPEKAYSTLAKGSELAAAKLAQAKSKYDIGTDWREWSFAQALLREAKALIEGQTSSAKEAGK
jgi:serine/threonine protein kinase